MPSFEKKYYLTNPGLSLEQSGQETVLIRNIIGKTSLNPLFYQS